MEELNNDIPTHTLFCTFHQPSRQRREKCNGTCDIVPFFGGDPDSVTAR